MAPRFSIIVPAHDEEGFIEQCLGSIAAQTFTDHEVLLVADSCTDATERLAREAGVEPIVATHGRAGLARNEGLVRARGEYLLFLDADDYYLTPDALRVIDAELTRRPVDLLHVGFMAGPRLAHALTAGKYVWGNVWSKAFRRAAVGDLRFGDLETGEDFEFLAGFMAKGPSQGTLDVPLVQYRFPRAGSLTDRLEAGAMQPGSQLPVDLAGALS